MLESLIGMLSSGAAIVAPYIVIVLGILGAAFGIKQYGQAIGVAKEKEKTLTKTLEVKNATEKAASTARGSDTADSMRNGTF